VKQAAASTSDTVKNIFKQMFDNTPLSWKMPTDLASATAVASAAYTTTDIKGLQQYVNQLPSVTINGTSLQAAVGNVLAACYSNAKIQADNERRSPNSVIYDAYFKQSQAEQASKTNLDSLLDGYTNQWTEAMTALANQNLPLKTESCKSGGANTATTGTQSQFAAVATYEVNCLTDVQNQMMSLLKGDSNQTPFTMQVTGQFPDTQIPPGALQCRGLNGCVTLLQQRSKEVTNLKQQLTTQEQSYIQQAKTSTQQFVTQMSQLLSQQSAALRSRMDNLNQMLRKYGISKVSARPIRGERLHFYEGENGQEGLPKMPDDMLALIGGNMNPPMPDVTDPDFADADGFREAQNKLGKSSTKLEELKDFLKSQETACATSDLKDRMTLAKAALKDFDAAKCGYIANQCDQLNSNDKGLGNLLRLVAQNAMGLNLGTDVASLSNALSSSSESCTTYQSDAQTALDFAECWCNKNGKPRSGPKTPSCATTSPLDYGQASQSTENLAASANACNTAYQIVRKAKPHGTPEACSLSQVRSLFQAKDDKPVGGNSGKNPESGVIQQ
jgi:hypothetical protein